MTQLIPAVEDSRIEHGLLLELTLQQSATTTETYYVSNCWKNITHNGHEYIALAGFLQVSEMQHDIQATNNEIAIALSAIPPEYLTSILGAQVKGGTVKIYRVFFDYDTQEVLTIDGNPQIFLRFDGIISNYSATEEVTSNINGGDVSHTISVIASNHLGIIEGRIVGRRTNQTNYQTQPTDTLITIGNNEIEWGDYVINSNVATDPSMNRVATLHNASFDFGKGYKP